MDAGGPAKGEQQQQQQRDCEAQEPGEQKRQSADRADTGGRGEQGAVVIVTASEPREATALTAVRVRRQGSNTTQGNGVQQTLAAMLAESEGLTGAEAEKHQLELSRGTTGALASVWAWVTAPLWVGPGPGARSGGPGGGGAAAMRRQPPSSGLREQRGIIGGALGSGDVAASPRMQRGIGQRGSSGNGLPDCNAGEVRKQPASVVGNNAAYAVNRRGSVAGVGVGASGLVGSSHTEGAAAGGVVPVSGIIS